jgi:hypothetical protein
MKQLSSLLLIILITLISWSSCAKNKVMIDRTIYGLSYPVVSSSILAPTLTAIQTSDDISYYQNNTNSKHNRFFEFSIVFNENLQQMISFFARPSIEKSEFVENNHSSQYIIQSTIIARKKNGINDI